MVNPKKQEEPIFEEPKFDKREYLSYERERAKAIILVFITGALVGLFSGYLEIFGYWYLAILLIIAVIYFFRRLIMLFKIAMPKRTTHKFLIYGELVIAWFVFWIIALNPPLHVASGPEVIDLSVYHSSGWKIVTATSGHYNIPLSSNGTDQMRYYTEYKYNITGIHITENGGTLSYHYNRNSGYVYFNVTNLHADSSKTLTVTENSTHVTTTKTFTLYS